MFVIIFCRFTSELHLPAASFAVQQQWQRDAAPRCCSFWLQSEKSGVHGQQYGNGSPPEAHITWKCQSGQNKQIRLGLKRLWETYLEKNGGKCAFISLTCT